jgi:hypothetical protein
MGRKLVRHVVFREAHMNAKTAALIIGVVFVLVGILGFFPNPLVYSAGALFAADTAHNLVHLVSGVLILAGAYSGMGAALTLKIFGIVYGLVALLGFFLGGPSLLGLIQVNHADHWLHAALAIVILAAGFMLRDETPAMA